MKILLKYLYHKTFLGHHIIHSLIRLHTFYLHRVLPEKAFLKRRYRKTFKRNLNLENPVTLNEKIIWLKLNDRTPLHTQCTDKYAVRNYIKEKIGEKYLVPLFFMTKNPKDIIPENLPEAPCIIKTNHDSGGGVFVKNKHMMDWSSIQKSLNKRLKKNYYYGKKEWQYKNIEPCIIVEQLLIDKQGRIPFDYKLHCFNGKVYMVQVDVNKFSDNPLRNYYNINWEKLPFHWSNPSYNKDENTQELYNEDFKKPKSLNEMITLSEILSSSFRYVRVDWYNLDGVLYFGELTFHTDSGNRPILPVEWDKKLGDKLKL